jgi:hypothetical protein
LRAIYALRTRKPAVSAFQTRSPPTFPDYLLVYYKKKKMSRGKAVFSFSARINYRQVFDFWRLGSGARRARCWGNQSPRLRGVPRAQVKVSLFGKGSRVLSRRAGESTAGKCANLKKMYLPTFSALPTSPKKLQNSQKHI